MHMEHQEDRRQARTLSDGDVQAIAGAIIAATAEHPCRFASMNPNDMSEAIIFYKNWNRILGESKGVVAKTILVLTVTALFGIMASGFVSELFKKFPK